MMLVEDGLWQVVCSKGRLLQAQVTVTPTDVLNAEEYSSGGAEDDCWAVLTARRLLIGKRKFVIGVVAA